MKKSITAALLFILQLIVSQNILSISRNEVEAMILSGQHTPFELFNNMYSINYWGCDESLSGGGSTLASTQVIRTELPRLILALGVKSLLDAPCGDYNWMKTLDLPIDKYYGIDIVEELIVSNKKQYKNNKNNFYCLNLIVDELPHTDLILCRDCLAHLSLDNAVSVIKNFKRSGAKYLLATTHIATRVNENIKIGETSPYNLQRPPFNFPKPLLIIEETTAENLSRSTRKCLGLWAFNDLDLP